MTEDMTPYQVAMLEQAQAGVVILAVGMTLLLVAAFALLVRHW